MRRPLCIALILLTGASVAAAQEEPRPEQLRKMYDDALVQLKQAQDRKNELAAENDKLNVKIADLQKQMDAQRTTADEMNRQAAGYAERTFFLRSQYAAWQEFLTRYPKLDAQWKIFLSGGNLSPRELPQFIDRSWPLTAVELK